jgi:tRNA threonylcarbamoyladenosine biosynthesis protein TsaE
VTHQLSYDVQDEEGTDRLGRALAQCLPDGTVVALVGTLGAGKTKLVERIASHCGIDPEEVTSPTFVLLQHYHGRRTIHHFDSYRLKDSDEFLELGADELFESNGLSLVEWADRVDDCLPADRLTIRLEETGLTSRRFRLSATSAAYEPIFGQLAAALDGSQLGE